MAKRVSEEALAKQERNLARKRAYVTAQKELKESLRAVEEATEAYMADSSKREQVETAAEAWKKKYILWADAQSALYQED